MYHNPRLLKALEPRFPHRCAIQTLNADVSASDETTSTWAAVTGQESLRCVVGPGSVSASDPNFSDIVGTVFFIDLLGVYAVRADNQAVVTFSSGSVTTYRILGVQPDGDGISTRLLCKELV